MMRSMIWAVLLSLLSIAGLSGCEKKSPGAPPAPTNASRGDFITEKEMIAERKAAQTNQQACTKYCGGPISAATNNPQKEGCSEERCKELYPVGEKRYKHCEGADCNDCNRQKDTYYSVNCPGTGGTPGTLDGCLIMLSSISKCE